MSTARRLRRSGTAAAVLGLRRTQARIPA